MTRSYSIGVDLHHHAIQICVFDGRGERVAEERIHHGNLEEGRQSVAFLQRFAPGCRSAVEALGLNRGFVNACRDAGLDILVVDPRKLDLKKLGCFTPFRVNTDRRSNPSPSAYCEKSEGLTASAP
jgi:hypothetical protein